MEKQVEAKKVPIRWSQSAINLASGSAFLGHKYLWLDFLIVCLLLYSF
jgi:RNA-splicing ligase RtcB